MTDHFLLAKARAQMLTGLIGGVEIYKIVYYI